MVFEEIGNSLMAVSTIFIYPFIAIVSIFLDFIDSIYHSVWSFIHMIVSIFDAMINTVFHVLTGFFPSFVTVILVCLFGVLILLSIWKKVKGISILGFKVG